MSRHRLERPRRARYRRLALAGVAAGITLAAIVGGFGISSKPSRHLAAAAGPHVAGDLLPSGGAAAKPPVDPAVSRRAVSHRPVTAVPLRSGHGRRVVFDISAQRVWLVRGNGTVASTYLVSGSLTDNLHPGHYSVYSRSRWAVGIDDSGVMQYFVRFTRGKNAAIGFHSIPTKNGHRLQTRAQLGTPQSHGCIRQAMPDAIRMWHFAPVGTTVVVTA